MKKLRPFGDVTHDLEDVIEEMIEKHQLQTGEILNIVRGYIEVHYPDAQEEYLDGTHPIFFYGMKSK